MLPLLQAFPLPRMTPGAFARAPRVLILSFLLISLTGCGSAIYTFRINAALSRFEQAKTLGAEESAPYDYYSAEVRIEEARRQAARAEYGSAIKLAREAEGFAGKAILEAERVGNTRPQDGP